MSSSLATPQGTSSLRARFPQLERAQFFRTAQGLTLSSLGIGTYLGPMDDETDRSYGSAIRAAVRQGINVIDTALNYRHQRSERAVGRAVESLLASGEATRDQLLLCTKAGYLVPKAVPTAVLQPDDVVGNIHCMAPAFLSEQLDRSLYNLKVKAVDVFYLHNPETQLQFLGADKFYARIAKAFVACEDMVAQKKIGYYGVATWDGFRRRAGGEDGLLLEKMVEYAVRAAGQDHHFRFVQLPFNFSMPEALIVRNQPRGTGDAVPLVEAAHGLGLTVINSATLLQGRLASDLPEEFLSKFSDSLPTQAQRAIQFTRSTPGITTSLIGMSKPERVNENMAVAKVNPFSESEYYSFYQR